MDKLARDVFVNVIANLIAAAALYLLAVGAGALPRNANLQLTASTSILGLLAGWALVNWCSKIGRQRLALISVFIPGGTYIALSGAVFPNDARPWWFAVALAAGHAATGAAVLLAGLWLALRYDQQGRHTQRRVGST